MPLSKGADGKFAQTRKVWTPENWDEGYVDARGYFRVYRPDYPMAWDSGYAKRCWVVYWLETGCWKEPGYDMHHKNEVKLDDRIDNLQPLPHGEHSRVTQTEPDLVRVCNGCQKEYTVDRNKRKTNKGFCSLKCYHATPRSQEHKDAIGAGLSRAYEEGKR